MRDKLFPFSSSCHYRIVTVLQQKNLWEPWWALARTCCVLGPPAKAKSGLNWPRDPRSPINESALLPPTHQPPHITSISLHWCYEIAKSQSCCDLRWELKWHRTAVLVPQGCAENVLLGDSWTKPASNSSASALAPGALPRISLLQQFDRPHYLFTRHLAAVRSKKAS